MNPFYRKQLNKFKNIFKNYPSTKDLIENLYFKAIIESYPRVKSISKIQEYTENNIRNAFVNDFKNKNSLLKGFIQHHTIVITAENQSYTSSLTQRTDIELFSSSHSHKFVIECKRLSSAENRYIHGRMVKGNYEIDGMEKFIYLKYSEKKDTEAAMLSFIVKGNITQIIQNLKSKIGAFYPSKDITKYLSQECKGWQTSFQSEHIRIDKSPIRIYHLFMDFS